ncbi:tetratricopeptide repeat protein [Fontivita pretiosa]|uniref:tetratricopeptide repeat protein n=1 Tax=Fontivita pretiosa TaxID=2989684 RepID=UPI003D1791C6
MTAGQEQPPTAPTAPAQTQPYNPDSTWFGSAQLAAARAVVESVDPLPEHIGDYRIIRKINEGGMGVVYEAEHLRLAQRAALKVVHPGKMTPALLRRFEHEAVLLARLNHHGIARIYYAGIADIGAGPQPFFAMELIEGQPLDVYLKQASPVLKLRQRMQLFCEICQAVSHAHSRGIVHRDLKPGNILVMSDGKPKILDFGVARAIDADAQTATQHTQTGHIVGTVPYMAPEQIRGQVDELDQATDVYALGVLGYELLAGRMPYEVKDRPLPEAARIICEEEPSRLSSIDRSMRGDVETIVQKAMEKDKTRRYPTAQDLAADVKRYLDYEPITARPPSTWYNLRKFAKRNKVVVASAGMVALAMVAATALSATFALRERRQRAEAQSRSQELDAVNHFFNENVLYGARPENMPDRAVREQIIKRMLDPAASAIRTQFSGKPLTEASVRMALVYSYEAVGRSDLALPHAEAALGVRRRLLGEDHPDTLNSFLWMGTLLHGTGKLDEADRFLRESVERNRRILGSDHPDTLGAINSLASLRQARGKLLDAELLFREALDRRRLLARPGDRNLLVSVLNLGTLFVAQGRFDEADSLLRDALEQHRVTLGDDHPNTLAALNQLATLLQEQGKLDEAEALLSESLERHRRVLGDDHPHTTSAINNMGMLLQTKGQPDRAEPFLREGLERCRRTLGDDHLDTLVSVDNLASLLLIQGKLSEAELLLSDAMQRSRSVLGSVHRTTLSIIRAMGALRRAQGRYDEAASLSFEAAEGFSRVLGRDHPTTLNAMGWAGALLLDQKKFAEAEPLLRNALEGRRKVLGNHHLDTLNSLHWMGRLFQLQGRLETAEALWREEMEGLRSVLGADHPETLRSVNNVGYLLFAQGRLDKAEPLLREALDGRRRVLGSDHLDTLGSMKHLGTLLRAAGRLSDAETLFAQAYRTIQSRGLQKHEVARSVVAALAEICDHTGRPTDAARWRAELAALEATTRPATTGPIH